MFMGEYRCEIKEGRVAVPWCVCASEDPLCWMCLEYREGQEARQKIILIPESNLGEVDEIAVPEKGACQFDEHDLWIIPDRILAYLNSSDCVFLGAGNHGELLTYEAYARIQPEDCELTDMMKSLKGL